MIQNGNLIRLMLDGALVAKLVALDLSFEREMLDSTVKDSSGWKQVRAGNKMFSLSCEGLVVDNYDVNILQMSENFNEPIWEKTGLTISPTLYAAPDGFIKANRTVGATLGDTIRQYILFNLTAGQRYVYSVWVRSVSGTVNTALILGDDDGSDTNAITATTTWQRFFISYNMVTCVEASVVVNIASAGEIELFGAQLELGSTPTDYDPTGVAYPALHTAAENGTKLTALITDQTTGNTTYSGDVYIDSIQRTAPQGQLQTFTCNLTGTSEITKATI